MKKPPEKISRRAEFFQDFDKAFWYLMANIVMATGVLGYAAIKLGPTIIEELTAFIDKK